MGGASSFEKKNAPMICEVFYQLVVSTHLENISVKLHNFSGRGENKEYLKPPPSLWLGKKSSTKTVKQTSFPIV